jgi:hypothetical protein
MRHFLFLCLALVTAAIPAQASPEAAKAFQETFLTGYRSGRCGANILKLLEKIRAEGGDISRMNVVEIRNPGFTDLGMVNAEWVRNEGRPLPLKTKDIWLSPGSRNWYFHVVLESSGEIYDFDFGNEPTVLPVRDYVEKMFLQEQSGEGGLSSHQPEKKLKDYTVNLIPAEAFLREPVMSQETPMSLAEFRER